MINKITIQPTAGLNYAYNPALAFADAKLVAVEGTVYDLMSAATNRACNFVASAGRIDFNNLFDGTQRVFIIYKT